MQVLAHGQRIERSLQSCAAGDELLHVCRLAALVIDDDAIASEFVDAIDAALDSNPAGKFKCEIALPTSEESGVHKSFALTRRAISRNWMRSTSSRYPGGKVFGAAGFVEGGFEQFDKIAALVGEPALECDVQDGTRDAGLQTLVGAFGRAFQTPACGRQKI